MLERRLLLVIALLVLPSLAFAQSREERVVGTWKLNVAKSTLASPGVKSTILTIEKMPGETFKHTFDIVDTSGRFRHERTAKFDNVDVPVTASPPMSNLTNALRWIDDHTFEVIVKQAGKEVALNRAELSRDNKTLTVTTTATDPLGKPVKTVMVMEKQ